MYDVGHPDQALSDLNRLGSGLESFWLGYVANAKAVWDNPLVTIKNDLSYLQRGINRFYALPLDQELRVMTHTGLGLFTSVLIPEEEIGVEVGVAEGSAYFPEEEAALKNMPKDLSSLTPGQSAAVKRTYSAIKVHAKAHDFLGVQKELAGIKILKSAGGYFNHVQEMRGTVIHLDKQMISMENSLMNPNLSTDARNVLTQAHSSATQTIMRMSNSLTSDIEREVFAKGMTP